MRRGQLTAFAVLGSELERRLLGATEMQMTLATLGAVALLAAIVGGGLQAAGAVVPVIDSVGRQVLLAAAGLGLLIAAFTIAADPTTDPSDPGSQATTGSEDLNEGDVTTLTTSGPTPSFTSTPEELSGCTIEVTHFAAQLKAEPDHSSRTLSDIPENSYEPSGWTEAEWAGQAELWFQITVDGRVGWVVDEPILLSKSTECP